MGYYNMCVSFCLFTQLIPSLFLRDFSLYRACLKQLMEHRDNIADII